MSTETKNYNLVKPDVADLVDIEVLNQNFDKIDAALKENADAAPPVATKDTAGIAKPDGTTITIDDDGTLHGTAELPVAKTDTLGGVKPDGETITVGADGTISAKNSYTLPVASGETLGGVMVGEGGITANNAGRLSLKAAQSYEIGGVKVHDRDSKPIYIDSDAVLHVSRASENDFGVVKAGKNLDCVSGVLSVKDASDSHAGVVRLGDGLHEVINTSSISESYSNNPRDKSGTEELKETTFSDDDVGKVFVDHRNVLYRHEANQHPISAITGLQGALADLFTETDKISSLQEKVNSLGGDVHWADIEDKPFGINYGNVWTDEQFETKSETPVSGYDLYGMETGNYYGEGVIEIKWSDGYYDVLMGADLKADFSRNDDYEQIFEYRTANIKNPESVFVTDSNGRVAAFDKIELENPDMPAFINVRNGGAGGSGYNLPTVYGFSEYTTLFMFVDSNSNGILSYSDVEIAFGAIHKLDAMFIPELPYAKRSDFEKMYSKDDVQAIVAISKARHREDYTKAMRTWFLANGVKAMDTAGITKLVDRWYELTRDTWDGYTEFYQPDVSAVSTGTKRGDNAGLTCVPSTDTVAGQDDYAVLPLFACVDCNWIVDADTLEPMITAIDGVTDGFERTNPDKYVGVLQMSAWHYWQDNEQTYVHGLSAQKPEGWEHIEPLPESVRVDGTMRQWMVHGKYASKTVNGKPSCYAGVIPTAFDISHNSIHALSAKIGTQYSGGTVVDDAFLKLMTMIKYGSLTLDGIIQGCCSCNYQYPAAVGETGVKRVIVTTAQAKNLEIGMSVLVGNQTSTTDRQYLTNISGRAGAVITQIEDVTINGATYSAVYVDVSTNFDTVANGANAVGTTYISSYHWRNGTCDTVLGNDGSLKSNTSGKYPGKIQGIEFMLGGYEVLADAILNLTKSGDDYFYEPHIVRRSAQQSTSITSNYVASGIRIKQPAASSWQYIKKFGCSAGTLFPIETGGSTSTYTKDGFYMNGATTGIREWLARGFLNGGSGVAGLSCVTGGYGGLGNAWWHILARLSPNGNRGEYVAAAT